MSTETIVLIFLGSEHQEKEVLNSKPAVTPKETELME